MRGFTKLAVGVVLAVAACSHRSEPQAVNASGASGMVGVLALRGQVVVAHPPGNRDALDQVRREAAARCPEGFVIQKLHTTDTSSASEFLYHLVSYDAVVECNPPPLGAGGAR